MAVPGLEARGAPSAVSFALVCALQVAVVHGDEQVFFSVMSRLFLLREVRELIKDTRPIFTPGHSQRKRQAAFRLGSPLLEVALAFASRAPAVHFTLDISRASLA